MIYQNLYQFILVLTPITLLFFSVFIKQNK
jgi:hypothetical protein